MSLLMGLNDSFAQIRGQLLLLDPIPPINKVLSLVSQEEHQRSVSFHTVSGGVDPTNGLAFLARIDSSKRTGSEARVSINNRGQKKERPFCTHCNFHRHTIEKCHKLHSYPPGYKPKPKLL